MEPLCNLTFTLSRHLHQLEAFERVIGKSRWFRGTLDHHRTGPYFQHQALRLSMWTLSYRFAVASACSGTRAPPGRGGCDGHRHKGGRAGVGLLQLLQHPWVVFVDRHAHHQCQCLPTKSLLQRPDQLTGCRGRMCTIQHHPGTLAATQLHHLRPMLALWMCAQLP